MVVNIHEAKTHLSRLLQRVAGGEEITIANAGTPVAKLVPVEIGKPKRELDIDKGKIWISEDFDAPDPEIEALFYGEEPPRHPKRKTRK